ncbi:MAG: hypothetical protein ABFC80_07990 [Coriobacteriales bacterium]|nr:hypothetical protein [Actinomycetes bacterium]
MEFSLICPQDGQVEVGLEDIISVVFRGAASCDIFFACPRCGEVLKASLRIPDVLAAALELARLPETDSSKDEDGGLGGMQFEIIDASHLAAHSEESPQETAARIKREHIVEAYCEYFRRQLQRVEYVDDLLAEIDGR